MSSIRIKTLLAQSFYVFKQNCARIDLVYESESLWKKVSFIVGAELLSGDRKRWTRYAASEKVNLTFPRFSIEIMYIDFMNGPMVLSVGLASIAAEGFACPIVDFYNGRMFKTGPFKT